MTRFPIDCPAECPHMQAWDMSIDDWTYVCNKLSVQIDGCDTWVKWLLPTCPIEKGEPMNDLISRQAAIDALKGLPTW